METRKTSLDRLFYMNRVDQILELLHLDRATAEDALLEVILQGATARVLIG
jgi:hypothetical protein